MRLYIYKRDEEAGPDGIGYGWYKDGDVGRLVEALDEALATGSEEDDWTDELKQLRGLLTADEEN
jgi:hypothetical protein